MPVGHRFAVAIAFCALILAPKNVSGEIGAIDAVPAATLLLPYFEVGLENSGNTRTTLFSINNAKAESVVVHITIWTVLSRPTLDFDVFLTGYDVQTYNLADLFLQGLLPQTPILPPGGLLQVHDLPPNCTFPLPPNLPVNLHTYIRNAHTGLPAPAGFQTTGLCAAPSLGEGEAADFVAKGYVTMDVVNECSFVFPPVDGYIEDGGSGILSNNNAIWGDFFLADPDNAFAQGDNLVHIEATGSVADGFWEAGDYTFYGRYTGFDGSDNREPLATTWVTRYFAASRPPFSMASDLFVWRGTGLDDSAFFECGPDQWDSVPAPYPLEQSPVYIWDEEETVVVYDRSLPSPFGLPPFSGTPPFPAAASRVSPGDHTDIFDAGWLRLDFNLDTGSLQDPVKQSFVSVVHSASGQFSVGFQAVHLDSALDKTFLVTTKPESTLPRPPDP